MRKCLVWFTTLLFLATGQAAYSQTTDLQKIRTADFGGGQNSKDFFDKLQPNESHLVQNLEINSKGQAVTRKGQALYVADVGSNPFLGIGSFYPDSTTNYVVVASGTAVARVLDSSHWAQISTSSLGSNHDTGFIQANNLLFVFNGSANTAWWNGTVWVSGGSWPTSPPTATTAAWLNNYLFLAGNSTNRDWVYVSSNVLASGPSYFPADTIIKVNTGDGQAIKRLEPYRTSEIIVYKERSIFDLDISGVNSSCTPQPICQWSTSYVSRDVGTPAPRSVVSLGNDQWFLSSQPYAVRSLVRTQFDKILVDIKSRQIQDIFDGTGATTLNTVHIDLAAAVLFDNKYILAIPTGSSAVNNFVVYYDFITNSWATISGWYPKDWLVDGGNLYYTDANDGRVVQCFTGTTGDFGTNPNSTSGPTVAITSRIETRGVDFGFPENYKNLDSVSTEFYPTGDYAASIYINMDNSGWQNVGTINLSGNALTLPFTLPATLAGDGFAIKNLQLQRYGRFKRIQTAVELGTVSETMKLQAMNVFGRIAPWQRDEQTNN